MSIEKLNKLRKIPEMTKAIIPISIVGIIGELRCSSTAGMKATMIYPIAAVKNVVKALPTHIIAEPKKLLTANHPALDKIRMKAFHAAGQKLLLVMAVIM